MRKIHFLLFAALLVQAAAIVALRLPARAQKDTRAKWTPVHTVPTSPVDLEIQQATALLQKLETGETDPFATPKNIQETAKTRPRPVPKSRLTTYDKMLATTEGGSLVRAETAARIEEQYRTVIGAVKPSPDELSRIKDILTDLEMAKLDLKSMNPAVMGYAELDKAYRVAAADKLTELQNMLGPDRYATALDAFQKSGVTKRVDEFANECRAFGVPLNDADRKKLTKVWVENSTLPQGLVIGSPQIASRDSSLTNWNQLITASGTFLGKEQQERLTAYATKSGPSLAR